MNKMLRVNTMKVLNHLALTLALLIVIKEKKVLNLVLIQTVMNFKYWCGFI